MLNGYGMLTFPHLVGQLSGGHATTPASSAAAEQRCSSRVAAAGIITASFYTAWLVKVKGGQFGHVDPSACLYVVRKITK
jgi:hypothetical protein